MDMNDDRTARKTQSLAAGRRRARGEYPSPMQSAGPDDVTGPQAPGRAAATARPSDTKASARPAVAKASARPSDTKASARPAVAKASARPSDTKASARPAVAKASARPSDTKASARPAVAKVSGAGKRKTGHAKPDARSAASTTANPKNGEAAMGPREEGSIAESIRHISSNIEEMKQNHKDFRQESKERDDALRQEIKDSRQESKEGDALLRQGIDKVDDRLWSAARWLIVAGGTIIAALLGMIWQLVFGMPT